jgi:hypothetical protein
MKTEPIVRATGKRLCWRRGWSRCWCGRASLCRRDDHRTVNFDGKAPTLKPLAMDADPACAKKHTSPQPNEMLVLGSGNTMGNVLVWGVEGTSGRQDVASAQDSRGHRPERLPLQAARDGDHGRSDLQDPQLRRRPPQHPHAAQGQPAFNKGMPPTLKEATTRFDKPEESSTSSATSTRG